MRGGIYQGAGEDCRQKVAESITLLQHARYDTSRRWRAVFQGRGGGVAIKPSHCNPEQSPACKELFVVLAKSCAEFEDDEEYIIDNKGPLSTISIGSNA